MAVQMSRPTKHLKSQTYRVRLGIPPHLSATALQMEGVRTELVENLRTRRGPVDATGRGMDHRPRQRR